MRISRWVKAGAFFLLGLILVIGLASCQAWFSSSTPPLATVDSVPLPQLPDWIEQISPTGDADPLAQIRIRFADPLIPVERLDSPDQQAILQQFEITPALPGRFRFLTPRMVGFQADQATPKAARVKVTLKAGLADLNQHRLVQDLVWTFNTEPIQLTNLPGATADPNAPNEPVALKPTLTVTSNVELDLNSLKQHASLKPEGKSQSIPLQVALKPDDGDQATDRPTPEATFNPGDRTWEYTLTPQQTLTKATQYQLEFSPGIQSVRGNVPSETAFIGQINTYAPLAFEQLQYIGQPDAGGAYGRFAKGAAQLKFNNSLVADSVSSAISIDPAPKDKAAIARAYDGDTIVNLNPWALEPNTSYTITIGTGLKDQFGQTLEKPVTTQYATGDVAADLWAPSGLHIFPPDNGLQLNITAVNLPNSQYKAAYRVVQPTDLVYTDTAYPQGEGTDLLPAPSNWQSFSMPEPKKNQTADIAVPLRQQLGGSTGLLAYGVQARTNRYQDQGANQWREPAFYGLVQLTNLGIFSQWFPQSGLIRVHHLSDGSAVNGARVEVYHSKLDAKSRPYPYPCAVGTTDGDGTLVLQSTDLRTCMTSGKTAFTDPPKLLTVVHEGDDWAFVRSLDWSGNYGYGVYAGWDSDQPASRGTIFSDRKLYQPGETAWFTGVAYYLQNGTLKADPKARYKLTLEDPNGKAIALGNQTTNDFGMFSVQVPLADDRPPGYYTIRAKGADDREISGEFRVAEFKPPNFKVELDLDKTFAVIGETVSAQAQSNYLFGPAVEGGKAEYYVTREKADFVPKNWTTYSFGRQWFYPEEEPTIAADVLQTSAALNQSGQGSQTIKVADDLPYPMTYRVDVQVTDVSNLSVADSKTFTALPSDRLIGLKADFVAQAGSPFDVYAVVTRPNGEAIANESLHLELQQMIYNSVTQVVEGSPTARNQVEYKTVAEATLRSGDNPKAVSLTPPESGSYRIRANLANAKDERTATDIQIWATGENPVNWGGRYDNNRLELHLDKDTYSPGETATVLIQSPYPEAELYFAVVRHDTIYKTITQVKGSAPQVQFQVTADMLPNAAVEAVLVRQGQPLAQMKPGSLDNLVRIGFAPFAINLTNQYLKVDATTTRASLQPGEEQTLQLSLQNDRGQPAQGQFTVMVVNEAVLQLTDYRPPDLVKTVYAEQGISTRFADNRPDVVLQTIPSPIDKGWGFGGGLSAGSGDTRIRTNFKPLAYYNGSILTDVLGKASVTFKLPDDLTTWRVMVIATDGQLHFGQTDTTFITTKPLVANPLLPSFARPGDRFEAGVSVTNNTNQSNTLDIKGLIEGVLRSTDATTALKTQANSGTSAYRFPVVATRAGQASVQFTTQLNDGNLDAFKVPLTVQPLTITEQVVETGTTETQVQIPVRIDPNVAADAGGLDISLASTLIPEITAPAHQVLQTDSLPFLEPAASQLTIAADLQLLSQIHNQTFAEFNPFQTATDALTRLQTLQRPDGGVAAYPGAEESDPFGSSYAAEAIAAASHAFTQVPTPPALVIDPDLTQRLKSYLSKTLANPGQYKFCKEQRCKDQVRLAALIALADLGEPRSDFLSDLYQRHDQFDPATQLKLVRYLSRFPDWQTEATKLANQLQEVVYETGRTARVNLPSQWGWLSSGTTVQAQALQLFVTRQAASAQIDRLLQGLLALRQSDGTWGSASDNAQALTALVDYSEQLPVPPRFVATAQLADQTLATTQFEGNVNPILSLTVPMDQLPRGNQTLTLKKSGQGVLHYVTAFRYRLQGNPPGRFSGIRVARSIHPANETKVLATMDLNAIDQPLTVQPGQVFDVGVAITVDHPVDHLVITDPLPAGFEAIDTTFQTATPYFQAQQDSWQISYQTIHRDRIVAYGEHLDAGVYSLHYLVRSVTPGTYLYPGAEAHLQYAPEEFGRSATSTLKVSG
jgi:uncharacterized protein YfaS (alpha-2-macroglobulin family)